MSPLYKFVGDPAVARHFLSGRIKFTPIGELNDPSELTSNVIAEKVRESLRRLRKDGYTEDDLLHLQHQGAVLKKLAPRFQAVRAPERVEDANRLIRSSFYDQIEVLERRLNETAREISAKVGVFCLSKRFDSLPMWAHYAGNATGFVVEFNRLNDIFTGDETDVLWKLTEVRYERETGGVTFEPESHDALFFEKFSDWSYEQEVRVVAPLDSCVSVSIENGHKIYVFDLPTSNVSRLILGWKMDVEAAEEIRRVAEGSASSIEVVQARFEGGCVRVQETPTSCCGEHLSRR